MKVVVTGAAGKIGRWVARKLMDAGHEVIASDRKLREESGSDYFIQADLFDYGQAIQLFKNCDAVVHLANIPTDVRNTPQTIFENNMIVNFNVFEACKDWNIKKIVWASSETVMGFPFTENELEYIPIDEEHPIHVKSSYAMAKVLTEQLAGMYHGLTSQQIVGLRFANIYETCMSINKARQVLGYNPEYSWRNSINPDGKPKAMPKDLLALSSI